MAKKLELNEMKKKKKTERRIKGKKNRVNNKLT